MRSSTFHVTSSLNSFQVAQIPARVKKSIDVPFTVDPIIVESIKHLPVDSALFHILNKYQDMKNINHHELGNLFDELCELEKNNKLTGNQSVLVEKYKLIILQNFLNYLNDKCHIKKKEEEIKEESKILYGLKVAFFALVALFGMGSSGIGDFMYGETLLALIPGISHPAVLICASIFTVLNVILFISFEASLMKNMLGLKSLNATSSFKTHYEQIIETNKINTILFDAGDNAKLKKDYTEYSQLAVKFNDNIKNLIPKYEKEYQEKWYQKIPRFCLTIFGGFMSIGGGYFMATSLLTMIAPLLIGTPIGWGIIAISCICMLTMFASMRGNGVAGMMNPLVNEYNITKDEIKNFRIRDSKEFDNVNEYLHKREQVANAIPRQVPVNILKTTTNLMDDREHYVRLRVGSL